MPESIVVEQEYQKRCGEHTIKVRPDIIIHLPTPAGGDRKVGNVAALELKLDARAEQARVALAGLDAILGALHYHLGIFVNIGSAQTHVGLYDGGFPDRIHCFAIRLDGKQTRIAYAAARQLGVRTSIVRSD